MQKLYRSRRDRMLTGLCGGIADWMGADPTFIRLAAVIAALFSFGTALLVYFLCSLVVPSEPHAYPLHPYHDYRYR
ncbi:MAG: hypothetical protein A9Z00_00570 [Thermobacillus sp. ZCTH02-B1]|uniref:PspC domain-containing protein n=1 Tax=Thermobacillus sp. ZCTH02-B1 TaxID=1858795 RepID=UPI000B550644|nr:PspC domain-containing protein [Thermobacillus sp. ZCTH02-B1]OUM94155.1 MAG: hypothetical protein A9Z00_00570 [Thermobacillus sp. ZCTH02-B1]